MLSFVRLLARAVAFAAAAALLGAPGAASALALRYDKRTFDHAVAARLPLVVHVCAGWSPLCRTQKRILDELMREPKMLSVLLLNADFDTDRELKRTLHVFQQATLVVFKEGREAARSNGDTDRAALAALLAKALAAPSGPGASASSAALAPRLPAGLRPPGR